MTKDSKNKIYCIVPAYNEAKTIVKVIADLKLFVENIIVVDDGSTDRTYDLAKTTGVVVLRHIVNRDQGAALQTGNEYALKHGADIIVHFDADGQFLAQEIDNLIKPIVNSECQIVFGSRFLGGASVNMPWFKKNFIFPLARVFNRIFFGVSLADPQCGLRAFSADIGRQIEIEQDGKAHCSEIQEKVFLAKIKYKEIPITVIYNRFGQKLNAGFKIIIDSILSKLLN